MRDAVAQTPAVGREMELVQPDFVLRSNQDSKIPRALGSIWILAKLDPSSCRD